MIAACSQNRQHRSETAETTKADSSGIDTVCFLRTSGSVNQDTSYIRIVLDADKITGDFLDMPYEKDSRKGTISGVKDGNFIKAKWSFIQEGMQDTLPVEFQIKENKLFQKEYSVKPETGRQFLSDTAGFTLEYNKINCF